MEEKNIENELANRVFENVRMASYAIDCIIEKIENEKLAKLLRKQNKFYLDTVVKIEKFAKSQKFELKDINPILKGMSYLSIKTKTLINNDSPKLSEMLIQGTTMGITDTLKALGEFDSKNEELVSIAKDIVSHEEEFVDSLKTFLWTKKRAHTCSFYNDISSCFFILLFQTIPKSSKKSISSFVSKPLLYLVRKWFICLPTLQILSP